MAVKNYFERLKVEVETAFPVSQLWLTWLHSKLFERVTVMERVDEALDLSEYFINEPYFLDIENDTGVFFLDEYEYQSNN